MDAVNFNYFIRDEVFDYILDAVEFVAEHFEVRMEGMERGLPARSFFVRYL